MHSGRRFEDFARIGADWFWETDSNDRFTYFSVATSQMGLDLAGRIGRSRADFAFSDPDNFARLAVLEGVTLARQPYRNLVYRVAGEDPARWCSISGDPSFDSAGNFDGYRGVGRDVTALVEAQAELELKSRALDAILAAIPDGVQVIDSASRTLAINDRLFEILDTPNHAKVGADDVTFQTLLTMAKRGEYGPGDPQKLASDRARGISEVLRIQREVTYEKQLTTGRWIEGRLRALDDQGYLALYRDITDDKKREAELERQSALLSTVVSNIDGGIAVYDKDMQLAAWNDQFADLVGIDPSLVRRGVSARELLMSQAKAGEFAPDDPEEAVERRLVGFLVDRPVVSERTRPNGRTIELRRHPIPDGGSVTVYIDITDRKHAEQVLQELNATLELRIAGRTAELAEAERFQRALVASVPGMVYRSKCDDYWKIEFASEGARELLAVAPEQLTDGTVIYLELIHPDDRPRIWQKWQDDSAVGQTFELEYRVRHGDGSWRWVIDRAHGVRDEIGEIVRLEGLVIDVTARKEAERELARVRDNLLDAIESLDQNMILYDREDRLVLMTHHIQEHYVQADLYFVAGRTFEEIFRATVEAGVTAVPPDQTKEQFVADRLERHRRADGSVTVRRLPDGRVLHIAEHHSQSGGIVATGRDVTEMLELEQKLHEAQRMEAIGQLSGGLAHDLNNYLAVVMGNLDLLAECSPADPDVLRFANAALAGAQRCAELTRNLLAFSQLQPLSPKVLDVGKRIGDVTRLLKHGLGEGIILEVHVDPDLWPVEIDGTQFDSAITKLVNNACEGMPGGGTLNIVARNTSTDTAETPAADGILIEVTDTGTGMDKETLAQAFEPFFSTKEAGHGIGFGLSMVHGFVHQSGGEIRLQSIVGKGTTVRLMLPRAPERRTDPAKPVIGSSTSGGAERILFVEDNEYVRETVIGQLKSLGYHVSDVESGDEAMVLLEQSAAEFDLVFSDVVMPGTIDGSALARIVGARWPRLRVLLTSGFSDDVLDSTDRKAFNFLSKPYRKADLARAVRAALS